jgi:hypothetical protein
MVINTVFSVMETQEAGSGSDRTGSTVDQSLPGLHRLGDGKSLVASALWAESSSSVRRPPCHVKRHSASAQPAARCLLRQTGMVLFVKREIGNSH